MARIPLQSQVAARQSEVQLSPGVFQQTAQATANLLSSAVGAVDMVKQQFDQAQELRNRVNVADGAMLMRNERAKFQQDMMADPASGRAATLPEAWGPEWQKRLPQIEAKLREISKAPAVQQKLGEAFKTFSGTSLIQISGEALKENLRMANQSFKREYEYNNENQDHDSNRQLTESNRDLLGDAATDQLLKQIGQSARKDEIEESRNTDPGHKELVEDNHWGQSKLQQSRELRRSEGVQKQREAEELDKITLGMQAETMDELEMIQAVADNPWVSGKVGAVYIKNYRNSKPLTDKERFYLQDKVDALYEFRDDPERYEAEWSKVSSEVSSYGSRKGVGNYNSDLTNARPTYIKDRANKAKAAQTAADFKPTQLVANEAVKKASEGLVEQSYLAGRSAEDDSDLTNVALKNDYERTAIAIRTALQTEVDGFIRQPGEKKTATEIKVFIDSIISDINHEVLGKEKKLMDLMKSAPNPKGGSSMLPNIAPGSEEEKIAKDWLK